MEIQKIVLSQFVPFDYAGFRLDKTLAMLFPTYSRECLANWIEQGYVLIDNQQLRPKDKIKGGENVEINAELSIKRTDKEENIPLNIVFEDDALLIINKPANMVVHPAAGNPDGTLLNALLHYDPKLRLLPRAGIIHRLDKDTTGLMVVAKHIEAYTSLVEQLQARTIQRHYAALVVGNIIAGATIEAPIDRHPRRRTLMAVVEGGKPAVTHYRVQQKSERFTLLKVMLETGRTHQIRVHLSYKGFPIVGDALYGWRNQSPKGASLELQTALTNMKRQCLHAQELGLDHPITGEPCLWQAPLPADFQHLLLQIKKG